MKADLEVSEVPEVSASKWIIQNRKCIIQKQNYLISASEVTVLYRLLILMVGIFFLTSNIKI